MPVFTDKRKRLLSEKAEAVGFFALINFVVGVTFCTLCLQSCETIGARASQSLKRKVTSEIFPMMETR